MPGAAANKLSWLTEIWVRPCALKGLLISFSIPRHRRKRLYRGANLGFENCPLHSASSLNAAETRAPEGLPQRDYGRACGKTVVRGQAMSGSPERGRLRLVWL